MERSPLLLGRTVWKMPVQFFNQTLHYYLLEASHCNQARSLLHESISDFAPKNFMLHYILQGFS